MLFGGPIDILNPELAFSFLGSGHYLTVPLRRQPTATLPPSRCGVVDHKTRCEGEQTAHTAVTVTGRRAPEGLLPAMWASDVDIDR